MVTSINLRDGLSDFEILKDSECEDLEIKIVSCTRELLINNRNKEEMIDSTIHCLILNFGENSVNYDIKIDDLELFAYSILKQVEIIRKNYGDQIKIQTDQTNLL